MKPLYPGKAQWPMALEELISRRDAYWKISGRKSRMVMVVLFTVLIIQLPLIRWMSRDKTLPDWAGWIFVLFLLGLVAGLVWYTSSMTKNITRDLDLICPTCQKPLIGKGLMAVAIATGNCGQCGQVLVSDHPSKAEAVSTPNRDPAEA